MRVTIDRAGAVDARVVEGHAMLREAAVNAAQQGKFEEDAAPERVATLKLSFVILPAIQRCRRKPFFFRRSGLRFDRNQ